MHALLLPFAVLAAVLMLSGLISGLVQRAPLSVPMIFLGLGYALGGFGLLRDVVRDDRVPRSIRQTLTTEAGANDIVVLPSASSSPRCPWAIRIIDTLRARMPISREYRALYGVGIVLASYAAGEFVGGSGFLAVFTAGVIIVKTDYDLCDCFLDYGEVTAEMAMLVACILFGALLSTMLGVAPLVPALVFAFIVLAVARPVAISLVLRKIGISKRARLFMGWFGPRGLSSLLFALLVVNQGVPHAEWLLAVTGIVVTTSVVLHGVTATPLAAAYGRAMERETLPEEREATAPGLFGVERPAVSLMSPETLTSWLDGSDPPLVLDVRSRAAAGQGSAIPGSTRVPLGDIETWAHDRSRERPIVTYCTCPEDASAVRAAELLQAEGFEVSVLSGGLEAWQAQQRAGAGEMLAA